MSGRLKFGDVITWEKGRVRWIILGPQTSVYSAEMDGYDGIWVGSLSTTFEFSGVYPILFSGRLDSDMTVYPVDDDETMEP